MYQFCPNCGEHVIYCFCSDSDDTFGPVALLVVLAVAAIVILLYAVPA